MKKVLFAIIIIMLSSTIFAANGQNSVTTVKQWNQDSYNLLLKWNDSNSIDNNFVYIILHGNTDNLDEFEMLGMTTSTSFRKSNISIDENATMSYEVFKIYFDNDTSAVNFLNDAPQQRKSLTWDEIKKLLKKKGGNIWRIRRTNIPSSNQ